MTRNPPGHTPPDQAFSSYGGLSVRLSPHCTSTSGLARRESRLPADPVVVGCPI